MKSTEQYSAPLFKLKKDIPLAKAGTIFYYDSADNTHGSLAEGCLKLAWTQNGNCQGGICGDTIIFHADARNDTNWFERIYHEEEYERTEIIYNGDVLYKKIR